MNHSKLCLPEIVQQNMASKGWSTLLPAQEVLLSKLLGENPIQFYAHGGSGKCSGLCIWLAAMFWEANKTAPFVRGRRPRVLIVSECGETSAQIVECFGHLVLGTNFTVMRCGAGRDYIERPRVHLGVDLLIGPASALSRQLDETANWFDDVQEIFFVDAEKLFEEPDGAEHIEALQALLAQIALTHKGAPRRHFLFNHWARDYEAFVKRISPKAEKTRLDARYKAPDLFERFVLVHKSTKFQSLVDEIKATPKGRRVLVCGDRRRTTALCNRLREKGIKAVLLEEAKPEDMVLVVASLYCEKAAGMSFDRVLLYRAPESPEVYESIASLVVFPATKSRPWCGELFMQISMDQLDEFLFMSEQLSFGKWRYMPLLPLPSSYEDYPALIEDESQVEERRALCQTRVEKDIAREIARSTTLPGQDSVVTPAETFSGANSVPVQESLFTDIEAKSTSVAAESTPEETSAEVTHEVKDVDEPETLTSGDTLAEEVVARIEEGVAEEAPEVTDEDETKAAAMPVEEANIEDVAEATDDGDEEGAVITKALEGAIEPQEEPEIDRESSIESTESLNQSEAESEDEGQPEASIEAFNEAQEEPEDAEDSEENSEEENEAFEEDAEDEYFDEDDDDEWEEVQEDEVDAWDDVEDEAPSEYAEESNPEEPSEEVLPHRRTLTIRSGYVPRQEYAPTVTITEPLSSNTVELRASQERMRRAMRGSEKLTHQMVGKRGTLRRPRRGAATPMAETEGILAAKPGARLPGEKRQKKGQKLQKNRKNTKMPGMYADEGQRFDRAERPEGKKRLRPKNKTPRQPAMDYVASETLTVPGLVAMPAGLPIDEADRTDRAERPKKNRQDRFRNRRNDGNKAEGQSRSPKKRWGDRRNSRRQQQENIPLEGAQTDDLSVVPSSVSTERLMSAPSEAPALEMATLAPVMTPSVPYADVQREGRVTEGEGKVETSVGMDTPSDQVTQLEPQMEDASGKGKKKFKPRRNNRFQKGNKDGEGNIRRDRRPGKKRRIPSPLGGEERQPMGSESFMAPGDTPRWSDSDDDNFGNTINFKPSSKRRKNANPWQTSDIYGADRPQTLTFAQTMPAEERREGLSTSFLGNTGRSSHSNRPYPLEGERRSNDGRKRFNNKKKFGFKNRKNPRNSNGQNGQGSSGDLGGSNSGSATGSTE